MAYCTQADILEVLDEDDLIQFTDDDGAGTVDEAKVARAIADADAEIDGYCGTKYEVPFTTVPGMIRKVSVDIAVYNLEGRRSKVSEQRQARYDNAVKFLNNVARGLISLGANDPGTDDDSGPEATTPKSDRIFTMGRTSAGTTGSLDNY